MMLKTHVMPVAAAMLALASCSPMKDREAGYDTSDPYGVPDYSAETATYEPVNPPADASYSPAAYEDTTPAAPATPAPAPTASRPTRPSTGGAAASRTHTVVKGDTLWGLSKKYGVSADSIKAANNMTTDTVQLGKKMKIPAR